MQFSFSHLCVEWGFVGCPLLKSFFSASLRLSASQIFNLKHAEISKDPLGPDVIYGKPLNKRNLFWWE
jgi:hypothetical protein